MATTSPASLAPINPLCRLPVIESSYGKKRSTIYREIKNGLFPKPVDIGGGISAWPANEIQALINARIAGKNDNEIKHLVTQLHANRVKAGA
jgi:prophage regulatory protein